MQKITPFIWFDNNAEDAMEFYMSLFKDSKVLSISRYGDAGPGPKGSVMVMTCSVAGHTFMAINGGPTFKPNPSISFTVACTRDEIDVLWEKLIEGGEALMGIDKYPWSERYGWVQDRYGVSWQLNVMESPQKIAPTFLFTQQTTGEAHDAMKFYVSQFDNSRIDVAVPYEEGEGNTNWIKFGAFKLHGQHFYAMDSGVEHKFRFNQGISLSIDCHSQHEVDMFWDNLSKGGRTDQCGWLADKYGVYWQVVPSILPKLLMDKDPVKANRVMSAMMKMTKLDIAKLQAAYDG